MQRINNSLLLLQNIFPFTFHLNIFFAVVFCLLFIFFCFLCPFLTTASSVCRTEFLLKTLSSFKTDFYKDMNYLKSWSKRKKAQTLKKKIHKTAIKPRP